ALLRTLPALPRARGNTARASSHLPDQATLWHEADGLGASATSAASKVLRNTQKELSRNCTTLLAAQVEAYQRHAGPPQPFIEAMRQAAGALSDHLEHGAGAAQDDALRFYFDIQHFLRMAETFGSHSVFETTKCLRPQAGQAWSECSIRNVVPAPFLKPSSEAAHSCVLFSATLQPPAFYADVLR